MPSPYEFIAEVSMSVHYEICGAMPVRAQFRHADAVRLAESLANPAHVYFAIDAVTHTLVIRVSGRLSVSEQAAVENALRQFSSQWARAGAVFSRNVYGEMSFLPIGLQRHVELVAELDDLNQQVRALWARQAWLLAQMEKPA
jgi:hypothetical protein